MVFTVTNCGKHLSWITPKLVIKKNVKSRSSKSCQENTKTVEIKEEFYKEE